jgi:hypothetical protein
MSNELLYRPFKTWTQTPNFGHYIFEFFYEMDIFSNNILAYYVSVMKQDG